MSGERRYTDLSDGCSAPSASCGQQTYQAKQRQGRWFRDEYRVRQRHCRRQRRQPGVEVGQVHRQVQVRIAVVRVQNVLDEPGHVVLIGIAVEVQVQHVRCTRSAVQQEHFLGIHLQRLDRKAVERRDGLLQ